MREIKKLIAELEKEYTMREGLDLGYLLAGTDSTLAPDKPKKEKK